MEKKLHLEFLRIIAIVLVIFNHTGEKGFLLYTGAEGSVLYGFYLFLSIACKVAVPLFWMISGALLINKEEGISVIYKKRVSRIVLALLLFSLIHYAIPMVKHPEMRTFDAYYFFNRLLCTNGFAPTYWYLYAYIGVLLMLPVIKKIARCMVKKEYLYLFILALLFQGVVPIVQYVCSEGKININGNLGSSIFPQNVIYFIAGYYLEDIISKKDLKGRRAVWLILTGTLTILVSCFATTYVANITGNYSEIFYNNLIFVPTFAIFYAVRYLFVKNGDKISDKMVKLLLTLGGTSFGIMLMEDVLRSKLQFIFEFMSPYCGDLLACALWVLSAWGCGVIGILIIKKIPIFGRLL